MLVTILILPLLACTPKRTEVLEVKPADHFDYTQTNLSSILEFANRFALSEESTQARICRALEQQASETPSVSPGVALHLGAAQLFLPSCGALPQVKARLVALSQDESSPADQRHFAMISLRLVAQHDDKTIRVPNKKAKSRKTAAAATKAVAGEHIENRPDENTPPKATATTPTSDAIARKKLEALRNLEKAMDRSPTP